ncbi:23S rRNA (uracil(1939)-C(5))-methyltransferase RlmD [Exiguobacterium flavidum]|uniref:23S rRNA (uracil(1939)-C(5))-methyltransferase RlmD n=1 Tax=Exiguobacterium flavidum TaxID=2184695 RepID=UPI000DF7BFF2|nr:23S rRNA (uracil(1939)-C(5))-methyltransferase RlmD [Exiguobacterium flavidum]
MIPVQKNEEHVVDIVDLTHEGAGVARIDGYTIFVEGALPTEQVKIKITKTTKSYGFARIVRLKKKSEDRVEPPCPVYTQCGGCQLQHLSYDAELRFKQARVRDAFQRLAGLEIPVHETLGMEDPWRYRNKAQVPVAFQANKLMAGFYQKRSHKIIDMDYCLIQNEENDVAVQAVRQVLADLKVPAYDEKKNSGVIRHIMARHGYHTNELMIVLVTKVKQLRGVEQIVERIRKAVPNVTSIQQNINPDETNVILGKRNVVLYGPSVIKDEIAGLTFEISPHSFFQVNPVQTEKLYGKAIEYAQLTGDEVVVDAYCGIGTISLSLAKQAKHVYGIEIVPQAIDDARRNAQANGIDNVSFEYGAAEDIMPAMLKNGIKPDVIVVDPPRKGCDEAFLRAAAEVAPKRIVYVSCNAGTQARDAKLLASLGYRLVEVTPVDMFPHTTHVESVALFVQAEA